MTEELRTKDQLDKFVALEPLDAGDIAAISNGNSLIRIGEKETNRSILLYVNEARALRDWLNKALP